MKDDLDTFEAACHAADAKRAAIPADNDRDRGLPHRSAGRSCQALRGLRPHARCL
jgi:hypothetical protein